MTQNAETPIDPRAPLRQLGEQISHVWWTSLAVGLVAIGFGLAVLATDWTIHALVVVTGIMFVIRGLALAFSPTYAVASSGEHVIAGALAMIVGIVLIALPNPTLLALAIFVGVWLAVSGGFQIVMSIARRHQLTHWGITLAVGVVELLLGIWAMRRPEVTLNLMITVIGLWAVITGVLYCVLAFEIRRTVRTLMTSAVATSGDLRAVTDQLDRLAQLHRDGMLSTEEYMQVKAALLATMGYDGANPASDPRAATA
jgi:uncharacterized membrane protein HdeD (DUF308 family)